MNPENVLGLQKKFPKFKNIHKFKDLFLAKKLKICLSINIGAPRQYVNKNPTLAHNRSTFWHVGLQMQKPPYTGRRLAPARHRPRRSGECQRCVCGCVHVQELGP